ncbi:MAG: MFS transporter [Anaerolineales bacterium]|nr:MFS transporter [Anaerolineales bacterium]
MTIQRINTGITKHFRKLITPGWERTLYIMFFGQLMTAVGFSSIFPFLPLYVRELGTQTGLSIEFLAGAVFSAQAITMMIASPVWGSVADRYGRKLMVERSMFGGAILLLLMAFVRSAEELVVLRAIQGLITGTMAAANALIAGIAPRRQMGYAMGLIQVGLGAGIALGPLLGGVVADTFGYSEAFYVTSALLFAAGLLVWWGVKESFVPTEVQKRKSFMSAWREILRSSGVRVAYTLRFFSQLGRMMIVPVAPLFVASLMVGEDRVNTMTGLMIGAHAATATISAVYLGRLGDRIGHRKIVIVCMGVVGLLYIPQSMVTRDWQLIGLQALAGIPVGGILPAISALLAKFTQEGREGAVFGLDNSIISGARSVAPLIGSGLAIWFGLRTTFLATGLLYLGAMMLAILKLPTGREESIPVSGGKSGDT